MRLHPRHDLTTRARIDMMKSVCDVVGRHDLTNAELTEILLGITRSWNAYAIRDEREAEELERTGSHGE